MQLKICVFLDISSSYAKILGETNFQPREFPRSGPKGKDGKREREKKERLKVGNNNGQLRIANAISGDARKATWANISRQFVRKEFLSVQQRVVLVGGNVQPSVM